MPADLGERTVHGIWECTNLLDSARLKHLFSFSWPRLLHLDLSHTTLDTAAVESLAKGSWQQLMHLSLSCSILETIAFTQLTQRDWPRLGSFDVVGAASGTPDTLFAAFVRSSA